MEKIEYTQASDYLIKTYTKEEKSLPFGEKTNGFFLSHEKGKAFVLESADEVPFVFVDPVQGLFGGMVLSKEDTLKEVLLQKFKNILVQYNLNAKDILCYLGPALTFSHVNVDRPTLLRIMELGYRAAAKRTSGVDFFDVPIMNFLMLRKLGIPPENITIDAHDTYECDSLLYSELRGDKEKNPTVVERLR